MAGVVAASVQSAVCKFVFCCNTRFREGIVHESTRLLPDEAMFKAAADLTGAAKEACGMQTEPAGRFQCRPIVRQESHPIHGLVPVRTSLRTSTHRKRPRADQPKPTKAQAG